MSQYLFIEATYILLLTTVLTGHKINKNILLFFFQNFWGRAFGLAVKTEAKMSVSHSRIHGFTLGSWIHLPANADPGGCSNGSRSQVPPTHRHGRSGLRAQLPASGQAQPGHSRHLGSKSANRSCVTISLPLSVCLSKKYFSFKKFYSLEIKWRDRVREKW